MIFMRNIILNMTKKHNYRCVNCGKPATALYKIYSPTVLKLTKCVSNKFV